jgi:predicted amidohydrolase YtcJ
MTVRGESADWMVVSSGRLAAVGKGPVPEALEFDRTVDFGTSAVLPALHDAHVHFLRTGLMDLEVDLSTVRRLSDVFEIISEAASSFDGRLLRAHSFDPDLLPDGRYPTAVELDAVSTRTPVLVSRRDGHSSVANTSALELLALPDDTPGIERESGRVTGTLRAQAHKAAANRSGELLTDSERVEGFRRAAVKAAQRGIGIVHALVGAAEPGERDRDIELLLDIRDELAVDVVIYPQTLDVEWVVSLGLPRIGGCILLDGSFSSGTAALDDPYADGRGNGILYYSDDELTGFFRKAHARGLQVAVHALGGRAISQALRCLAAACGTEARERRHRIEHCELPTAAHLAEMRRLGVSACVQPTFEHLWGGPGGMYERRLGASRAARSNPFRTMLEAGVHLAGGSDSYVTPMDSLLGIHAAVNRPNEEERLDVFAAASLYTSGASWFTFDDRIRGSLEEGKEASFVVLDADPFDISSGEIRHIGVAGLYLKGEEVFALPLPDGVEKNSV